MLAAVTFDFWNTLVCEAPGQITARRVERWGALLATADDVPSPATIRAAFGRAWAVHEGEWRANRQFGAARAAAQAMDELGVPADPELRARLHEAFAGAGADVELQLAPGVEACLRALDAAGVALGIVCDVGFTASPLLRDALARHGVLELFGGWAFSDEVGAYKPSPAIFAHALAELGGVDPARAAHVGDLRRTDVAGALAMGMRAVRYTGVHDDAEGAIEGHHVVADHADLPRVLGIG